MKRLRAALPLLLCALCLWLTACEHRPLEDPNDGHYIRVYVNEQIKNVTYGFYDDTREHPEYVRPAVLRLLLADVETGDIRYERYLQSTGLDERGYYIEGYIAAPAGTYNLLLYSFGSATTLIRNERNYYDMQAYTDPISERYLAYLPASRGEYDERRIVFEPDHLFHDVGEPITIRPSTAVDTLRNAAGDYFTAHSVVLSYYLQVRIRGIEWVTSAVSLLSGMAGSTVLHGHRDLVETDPVQLFFDMQYTDRKRASGTTTAVLYTTFNTFGKLPEAPSVYTLNFEFIKTDGSSQVEKLEITPLFDTPQVREEQWILLDHEIVITPPDGAAGGMTPGVDDWEDVTTDVPL